MIDGAGCSVDVVGEIQRVKFRKNLWNVAFSSLATLTGYPIPAIFRPAPTEFPPPYSPYVSPTTAAVVAAETIPALHAILREVLALGI
jgi:2-dehydropantoate 2-reductase